MKPGTVELQWCYLASDDARSIIAELNALVNDLKRKELKISSWYVKLADEKEPFEQVDHGYHYTPLALFQNKQSSG